MAEAERFLNERLGRDTQGGQNAVRPQAGLGAVVIRAAWFTVEGRLNRIGYFLRVLCVLPVALVGNAMCEYIPAIGLPLLIAAVGVNVLQMVKRFHDLGRSGWLFLLMFVPVVNVFVGLWLLFGPGVPGGNRYGDQPA